MMSDDAVAYLVALADGATVMTAARLADEMGDTVRMARRRVELLAAAGLIEAVHMRGYRANALGRIAAARGAGR